MLPSDESYMYLHLIVIIILYSRKYWQELNLAVGPQIGIAKILVDLKDRHVYICEYEILVDVNLAVAKIDCQTAKFNSLPNFPAIRYQRK